MKSPLDGILCSEFDGHSFDTSYEAFWLVSHTVYSDFICHWKFGFLTPFFPRIGNSLKTLNNSKMHHFWPEKADLLTIEFKYICFLVLRGIG